MAGQEARRKAAELGYTTAIAVSDGRAIGWKTTPRVGKKTIRAIGVVIIAVIAGTTQGLTAYLLGSSYAVALGLIAGFLDMIPNIGATIGGFVLSPTLLAEEGLTAALIMLAVVLLTGLSRRGRPFGPDTVALREDASFSPVRVHDMPLA